MPEPSHSSLFLHWSFKNCLAGKDFQKAIHSASPVKSNFYLFILEGKEHILQPFERPFFPTTRRRGSLGCLVQEPISRTLTKIFRGKVAWDKVRLDARDRPHSLPLPAHQSVCHYFNSLYEWGTKHFIDHALQMEESFSIKCLRELEKKWATTKVFPFHLEILAPLSW